MKKLWQSFNPWDKASAISITALLGMIWVEPISGRFAGSVHATAFLAALCAILSFPGVIVSRME